jgi:hypothetical protein
MRPTGEAGGTVERLVAVIVSLRSVQTSKHYSIAAAPTFVKAWRR